MKDADFRDHEFYISVNRTRKFIGMTPGGKTHGKTSVAKQVSAEFARALLFFDSLTTIKSASRLAKS